MKSIFLILAENIVKNLSEYIRCKGETYFANVFVAVSL